MFNEYTKTVKTIRVNNFEYAEKESKPCFMQMIDFLIGSHYYYEYFK